MEALGGLGGGSFVDVTTVTTDGGINSGYTAAERRSETIGGDAMCDTEYPGSHWCSMEEVVAYRNQIPSAAGNVWVHSAKDKLLGYDGPNEYFTIYCSCKYYLENTTSDYGGFSFFIKNGGSCGDDDDEKCEDYIDQGLSCGLSGSFWTTNCNSCGYRGIIYSLSDKYFSASLCDAELSLACCE